MLKYIFSQSSTCDERQDLGVSILGAFERGSHNQKNYPDNFSLPLPSCLELPTILWKWLPMHQFRRFQSPIPRYPLIALGDVGAYPLHIQDPKPWIFLG